MYWKTKTIDGRFHMINCETLPNRYWEYYEPDIDTKNYYEANALIKSLEKGTLKYAVIEIIEDEI